MALEWQRQSLVESAHPTYLATGCAYHQGEVRNVTVDDRSGTDKRVSADRGTADHGAVSASTTAEGWVIVAIASEFSRPVED
jgi:hypothetical protein